VCSIDIHIMRSNLLNNELDSIFNLKNSIFTLIYGTEGFQKHDFMDTCNKYHAFWRTPFGWLSVNLRTHVIAALRRVAHPALFCCPAFCYHPALFSSKKLIPLLFKFWHFSKMSLLSLFKPKFWMLLIKGLHI